MDARKWGVCEVFQGLLVLSEARIDSGRLEFMTMV
jgi:hypothetical protein